MSASASSAMSGSSAATAATFSPMKRTRSRARSGMSNMRRPTRMSGRSAAVSTARTPGSARALDVSIFKICAWGSGLRSALPHTSPGSVTSAEYRVPAITGTPGQRYLVSRRDQTHHLGEVREYAVACAVHFGSGVGQPKLDEGILHDARLIAHVHARLRLLAKRLEGAERHTDGRGGEGVGEDEPEGQAVER